MVTVTVARAAMATRFEIVLHGSNAIALRAAAEAALNEIDRLEAQLSFYLHTSDLSQLNAHAATRPVQVDPALFELLQRAQLLHRVTHGAFDLTVAPLMRCWGFTHGPGHLPSPPDIEHARNVTGMHLIDLDPTNFTVRFKRPGVLLDPGAIGKGFAIESAAEILREAGAHNALIHGGTSTVCALGSPSDSNTWQIALPQPHLASIQPSADPHPPLRTVSLRNQSLSVSAVWGKSFQMNGRTYGHVLDPRRLEPVSGALMAAVIAPSATDADALSTALLVLGPDGQDLLLHERPDIQTLVVNRSPSFSSADVTTRGAAWSAPEN
jgi:FAD:protein FMN transferase